MNTNNEKIKSRVVSADTTIIDALKQMDREKVKLLLVFKDNQFISILTIGDIQRAIIAGKALNETVIGVPSGVKKYASVNDSKEIIRERMVYLRAECMPVVNKDGDLVDVIFWNDIMSQNVESNREKIDVPVVIMAGGLGTRLRPITNVIPKPLIPVGDKTILEAILDQFTDIGCHKFYISVNYKFEIIRYYLDNLPKHYDIEFVKENRPLGTVGSVSMLKGKIHTPFFITNCDTLINQDYRDIYEYHIKNGNDITIVTALKSYSIPYGVVETIEGGMLVDIHEKPEMAYQINTGVYILNSKMIDEIPENEFFHITKLVEKIRKKGGKIGCFPVSDGSWTDIGEWNQYLKLIDVR